MPDLYVRDTILLTGRTIDRSIPKTQGIHLITKKKPEPESDGEVVIRIVSKEEMEELWK